MAVSVALKQSRQRMVLLGLLFSEFVYKHPRIRRTIDIKMRPN